MPSTLLRVVYRTQCVQGSFGLPIWEDERDWKMELHQELLQDLLSHLQPGTSSTPRQVGWNCVFPRSRGCAVNLMEQGDHSLLPFGADFVSFFL